MMPAEEGALLSADSPGALLGLLVGKLRTLRAELDAAWDDMRVEESDAFTSSSDFVEYLRGLLFSVLQIGDVNPDDQTPEPEVVQPALDDPRQDESPGEERFYTCRTSPPPLPPRRQRRASPKHFFKLAMPEPTGCTANSRECTNNEACSARILATSSSSGTAGNTTDREPAAAQPPAADHAAEHPADRPKSFLREEVDEFEKIFSELLLNGNKGQSSLSSSQETLAADDDDVTECADDDNEDMLRRLRNRLPGGAPPREKDKPPSPPEPVKPPTDSDQLFSQLLDDLDNITVNASSVKRRQKAREIFSDWLFNRDAPHGTAHDIVRRRRKTSASAREAASKRLSADVAHFDARRHELLAQWRPRSFEYQSEDETDSGYHTGRSTLRCSGRYDPSPLAVTPSNTLPASANQQAAISREELRRKIESFNGNQHGLIMSMQGAGLTFQGFIRVHMNLIRPINMSVSARPPSIYDVLTHGEEEEVPPPEVEEITSFYLPKDTTKVIHIDSHTTAQEVIKALLAKFKITDNPRKFALYEKPLGDGAGTMRRLMDDETPLTLCLSWTAQGIAGLDVHKFILQENDTGEIMWEAFSLPELENFLRILNKEEDEYLDQVKAKYRLLRIQIGKRLADLKPSSNPHEEDKRQPVFV